jgi:exodeoxyribonuclease III
VAPLLGRERIRTSLQRSVTGVKIATFNINDVNKRLDNLLHWLQTAGPDVACLQELKAVDREFPQAAIEKCGYQAAWRGEKSWNGVAILARGAAPIVTRTELPGDSADKQSRYIEAAVGGVLIGCLYAPNGNPQPGPKFTFKLAWLERLREHAAELFSAGVPVVLAGDYNVVPTDRDIYPTTSYVKNALVQPQSRAAFRRLLDQGWVDAIRVIHPNAPMYTFWDYMRKRWERDAGLRLDHLLLSANTAARLQDAGVDRYVRGEPNASDHAPAWIVLRDEGRPRGVPRPDRSRASSSTTKASSSKNSSESKPKPSTKKEARAPGRPLLVIDGDSFAHRAYHALPKTILRNNDRPAGAILGFANFLLRFYQAELPRAVLVAWDTLDAPTYRHEAYANYQSGRAFDEAIIEQLAIIPKFVVACGFVNAKAAGYEADDFLAAAVAAEERRGGTVLVASGDRDAFQLASEHTTILFPVRAGELARIGPAEVRARYGVDPERVPDFIALRGDPSDKIPGVPGLGAQGAAEVVRKYGSLEAALKAGRFAALADRLRLFRDIATMNRKAPLPRLKEQTPTWDKASALARQWRLNQLAERLQKRVVA